MSMQAPRRVGVIGAGQMGSGIAHVCATSGLDVMLLDANAASLPRALASIGKNMDRQVAKQQLTQQARDEALGRIHTATDYTAFNECQLVIEAATEKEAIKCEIYKTLAPHLPADSIIASNTSSIPITRLAAASDRPDRFIGMHFMNPVPVMQLVEVIRGIATAETTFQTVMALTELLGKTAAVSEDFPGFIVNRVLLPMINEAIYALHEGVGTVHAIDTGLKLGANHPMGPLQLADFIGLDTCLFIMRTLYDGLADSKYRPCPLLTKYVEAGWLGRKTGRGFYDYSQDPPRPTR